VHTSSFILLLYLTVRTLSTTAHFYADFLACFPYFENIKQAYEIALLSVCVLIILLGSDSVNTFPQQRMHSQEELLDAVFSMQSVSYQMLHM
jgi:hypothetical protein